MKFGQSEGHVFVFSPKINGITGTTWTYSDLLEQSKQMARALHGAGLRRNDVISIVAENRLEYPAIAFGAFFLNAIVAPVNATYTERKFNRSKFT